MEALELRLGNWVYDKRGEQNIECTLQLMKQAQNRLNPILITEDWLLKFGFDKYFGKEKYEYDYDYYDMKINSFSMVLTVSEKINFYTFSIGTKNQPIDDNDWIDIEHVHQLQNLYFALTNQELTTE